MYQSIAPAAVPRRLTIAFAVAVLSAVLMFLGTGSAHASSQEDQVFSGINSQRSSQSLPALTRDGTLDAAARSWATEMAASGYRHSTYAPPGAGSWGENIAMGQGSADSVMVDWMNSPAHRDNILNFGYTRVGIGYDPNGNQWVQIFAGYWEDYEEEVPEPAPAPAPAPVPAPVPEVIVPAPAPVTPAPAPEVKPAPSKAPEVKPTPSKTPEASKPTSTPKAETPIVSVRPQAPVDTPVTVVEKSIDGSVQETTTTVKPDGTTETVVVTTAADGTVETTETSVPTIAPTPEESGIPVADGEVMTIQGDGAADSEKALSAKPVSAVSSWNIIASGLTIAAAVIAAFAAWFIRRRIRGRRATADTEQD